MNYNKPISETVDTLVLSIQKHTEEYGRPSGAFLDKILTQTLTTQQTAHEANLKEVRGEIYKKLMDAKCHHEKSRGVLLSKPPQYQCEACGNQWVYGTEAPICRFIEKSTITLSNKDVDNTIQVWKGEDRIIDIT